jgi:integrase
LLEHFVATLDLLPRIHEGDLRRALKKLPLTIDAPTFLRLPEIAALLEAALSYDAETFKATRDEHAGEGERGTTARYEPVAAFVATLLLTGMRFSEAIVCTRPTPGRLAAGRQRSAKR